MSSMVGEDEDYGIKSINSNLSDSSISFNNSLSYSTITSSSSIESLNSIQSSISSLSSQEDHEAIDEQEEQGHDSISSHSTTPSASSIQQKQQTPEFINTRPQHQSLANYLNSELSLPSSPSPSHNSEVSIRSDSTPTSGSVESNSSQSGENNGIRSELVMPFLDLNSSRVMKDNNNNTKDRESSAKFLIYGSTDSIRKKFGLLLSERDRRVESEMDLSASFLTNPYSDTSVNSRTSSSVEDLGNLIELSSGTSTSIFYTISRESTFSQLLQQLLIPLEKTSALLNPSYPSTERMVDFVLKGVDSNGTIDACLMLLSSPPTISEVATARALSKLVPIIPILLLPPSPKAQKTAALLEAVDKQLTSAGVQIFTNTFDPTRSSTSPFYCLSHDLFQDDFLSSCSSSLASSQELVPPTSISNSNSNSSNNSSSNNSPLYHQVSHYRDLNRLRNLVSNSTSRDSIKRRRILSFLDWREIDLASRGIEFLNLNNLPFEWNEIEVEKIESNLEKDLEFSKRVGERRLEIQKSKKVEADRLDQLFKNSNNGDHGIINTTGHQFPQLTPTSYESKSFLDSSSTYFTPSLKSKSVNHQSSPSIYLPTSIVDPFHFPSLLHLVGLNLKLSLLPPLSNSNSNSNSTTHNGVRSGLVVGFVGFVFVAGLLCGKVSLLWRD